MSRDHVELRIYNKSQESCAAPLNIYEVGLQLLTLVPLTPAKLHGHSTSAAAASSQQDVVTEAPAKSSYSEYLKLLPSQSLGASLAYRKGSRICGRMCTATETLATQHLRDFTTTRGRPYIFRRPLRPVGPLNRVRFIS